MRVKNAATFVFLLFLMFKTEAIFSQEQVLTDSASFVDFLQNQGEIPGISFNLLADSTGLSTDTMPSATKFTTILALQDSLFRTDSMLFPVQIQVFSEATTFSAAQEYVSNLLRNGDIVADSDSESESKDLISLANRERYSPLPTSTNAYIGDFKVFVVVLTISLFIIFAIGMILFMLIFKARRNRKEKLLSLYDEQIVGPLSEILFEKSLEELESLSDEELYQSFPAKQLKKPIYEQVLVERILALNKKMKGDFKLKLKALYKRLKLDRRSVRKLNSSKWDTVVKGLVEINEMDLSEATKEVKKHINSPNFYIRSQAVGTLLNISAQVDLSFLRDQTFPLSRWQQMNYLRIIKFLNTSRDLNIHTLFSSDNQSIRMFGYKLVRILGLVDQLSELEEKFNKVSDDEKIEIIRTLEYLGVPSESALINRSLQSGNQDLVYSAGKAAGAIGDQSTALIICELLNQNPTFKLKIILLKSLQSLDMELYSQIILKDSSSEIQRINRHLLDPLLQDV